MPNFPSAEIILDSKRRGRFWQPVIKIIKGAESVRGVCRGGLTETPQGPLIASLLA